MRIGILSDTHDKLDRTRVAVALLRAEGAEVLFHCGDLTSPPIVEVCAEFPCYFTFGNNDADGVIGLRQAAADFGAICLEWGDVVEMAGKKIGLVHGHLTTDRRRVMESKPDYLFSGHSHRRSDSMEGTVRRINPGALHRADEFTVAVLELETGNLSFLTVSR